MAIDLTKVPTSELQMRLKQLKTGGKAWRETSAELEKRIQAQKGKGAAKVIVLSDAQTTDYQLLVGALTLANGIQSKMDELTKEREGMYLTLVRVASHYETPEGFTEVVEKLEADVRANVNGIAVDTGCKLASKQPEEGAPVYAINGSIRTAKSVLVSAFEYGVELTAEGTDTPRAFSAIRGDVKAAKAAEKGEQPLYQAAAKLTAVLESVKDMRDGLIREAEKKDGDADHCTALLELAAVVFASADMTLEDRIEMADASDDADAAIEDAIVEFSGDLAELEENAAVRAEAAAEAEPSDADLEAIAEAEAAEGIAA